MTGGEKIEEVEHGSGDDGRMDIRRIPHDSLKGFSNLSTECSNRVIVAKCQHGSHFQHIHHRWVVDHALSRGSPSVGCVDNGYF